MAQEASLPKKKEELAAAEPVAKKAKAKPVVKDLKTLRLELRNLIMDIQSGKEKNTSKLKPLRRAIAQELTKQNMAK